MAALLNNLAIIDHHNGIGILNGRETVRDY